MYVIITKEGKIIFLQMWILFGELLHIRVYFFIVIWQMEESWLLYLHIVWIVNHYK